MPEEKSDIDKKSRRTMLIICLVVIPTLLVFAGLLVTHVIDFKLVDQNIAENDPMIILTTTKLKCYNINWFGTEGTGFQIVFKETMDEVISKLNSTGIEVDQSFFQENNVIKYLVNVCPHLDNRDQVPKEFDPKVGSSALDKCIERKHSSELCIQLIK